MKNHGKSKIVEKEIEHFSNFKMVIKVLEKAVPKKPLDVRGISGNSVTGRCPTCNRRQSLGSLWWHKEFNKFCIECGQALDWSE